MAWRWVGQQHRWCRLMIIYIYKTIVHQSGMNILEAADNQIVFVKWVRALALSVFYGSFWGEK